MCCFYLPSAHSQTAGWGKRVIHLKLPDSTVNTHIIKMSETMCEHMIYSLEGDGAYISPTLGSSIMTVYKQLYQSERCTNALNSEAAYSKVLYTMYNY